MLIAFFPPPTILLVVEEGEGFFFLVPAVPAEKPRDGKSILWVCVV
jgi:hypothetical protein